MIEESSKLGRFSDPRCLERREVPGVFLRLSSPREHIALPYACLLKLALSLDETSLELSFATHRVTLTGKNLAEVYVAVAEGEARHVHVVAPGFSAEARLPSSRALVRGLRIEPLDAAEKQKR
jgi:hypothetical protein